jgi:hypothetical protein
MKNFFNGCLTVFLTFIVLSSIIYGMAYCAFAIFGPNYKEGIYTMTYKVYYPDNPKTYTITNNWPIDMTSYRGTNRIDKTIDARHLGFKNSFRSETVFESSAPIEVVSYTYKEK